MRFYVGEGIPGLNDAVHRALPRVEGRFMIIPRGLPASDVVGGPVTIEEVLASVEAKGFRGARVANHVAWLCKGDPRVVQRGIIRLQRETEAALQSEEQAA